MQTTEPQLTQEELDDQYHSATINLTESFNHFKQNEVQSVGPTILPNADQLVSFQNTMNTMKINEGGPEIPLDTEQLDIKEGTNQMSSGVGNQSQEFLQLLKISDQLNTKIDKVKQQT